MRFLFLVIILSYFVEGFCNELSNSTSYLSTYEDDVSYGGIVKGSWSIGGYDSKFTYECSGIAGATDC